MLVAGNLAPAEHVAVETARGLEIAHVQHDVAELLDLHGSVLHVTRHFDSSAVLHWSAGAEGRGALLVGDTMTVTPDTRYVSFMRRYLNHIPLPALTVRHIVDAVRPYP